MTAFRHFVTVRLDIARDSRNLREERPKWEFDQCGHPGLR
jgi:hypothetical protein